MLSFHLFITGKHDQAITVQDYYFFPSQFAAHKHQQRHSEENELFLDITIAWAKEYELPPRLSCVNGSARTPAASRQSFPCLHPI